MEKIEKLKKFLQENYPNIQAFNTRNIIGDYMENVYDEDNMQVDYCPDYEYIEIFGLIDEEIKELKQIIDLMSLDLLNISKGNFNINEKQYSSAESVKLDYIKLLKEQ